MERIRVSSIWQCVVLGVALATVCETSLQAESPRVDVVVGPKLDAVERFAVQELVFLLKRLFDADVQVHTSIPKKMERLIFLGNERSNPAFIQISSRLPKLSDQGHALKSVTLDCGPDALVVTGGSPRATLWAVCELGHRLGMRSFMFGDLYPIAGSKLTLVGFDIKLEPTVTRRAWRLLGDSPISGESWSLNEQELLLRQLAKLKFTDVEVRPRAWQPFADFSIGGKSRTTAEVFRGDRLVVDGDTAGRTAFGGAKFFEAPWLREAKSSNEKIATGTRFLQALKTSAERFGLTFSVIPPTDELPAEFASSLNSPTPSAEAPKLAVRVSASDAANQAALTAQSQAYEKLYGSPAKSSGATTLVMSDPQLGVVPQMAHNELVEAIAKQKEIVLDSWSRDDPQLALYCLSRNAFGAKLTPEAACEAMVTPVCGEEVHARVWKAFQLCAEATSLMRQEKAEGTLNQSMLVHAASADPPPAWWGKVRDNYLNAMNEMYRANTRAREGGRVFSLYMARRFDCGFEFFNCVEAVRKAKIARSRSDKDGRIAELEKAIDSITGACNAMSAIARSNSDRGVIAVLNQNGYHPLIKELEAADAE